MRGSSSNELRFLGFLRGANTNTRLRDTGLSGGETQKPSSYLLSAQYQQGGLGGSLDQEATTCVRKEYEFACECPVSESSPLRCFCCLVTEKSPFLLLSLHS